MTSGSARTPVRGEIWWAEMPTDPPGKGKRPVVIVSIDSRNLHVRASTVLVVPLSTSVHSARSSDLLLRTGDTGLQADSVAQASGIAVVRKEVLSEPRPGQRALTNTKICQLAELVRLAMGCVN